MVQLSHPYMTTGKTTALTRWTFVGKVMSLLFNMLSRLVRAFLPRSKCLLISWLQPPSAVILEPKKINSHCFHCFPIYFPWSDGTRCPDVSFLNAELWAEFFTLLFHFHLEAPWFLSAFCRKGDTICIPRAPELGAQSLSPWATRVAPGLTTIPQLRCDLSGLLFHSAQRVSVQRFPGALC